MTTQLALFCKKGRAREKKGEAIHIRDVIEQKQHSTPDEAGRTVMAMV